METNYLYLEGITCIDDNQGSGDKAANQRNGIEYENTEDAQTIQEINLPLQNEKYEQTRKYLQIGHGDCHSQQSRCEDIDSIQSDLDNLINQFNAFTLDFFGDDYSKEDATLQDDDIFNLSEKQDESTENEFKLNVVAPGNTSVQKTFSFNDQYLSGLTMSAITPQLRKHVKDMQHLRSLNQSTMEIVERIRNVTQVQEAILREGIRICDGINNNGSIIKYL